MNLTTQIRASVFSASMECEFLSCNKVQTRYGTKYLVVVYDKLKQLWSFLVPERHLEDLQLVISADKKFKLVPKLLASGIKTFGFEKI